MRIVLLYMIFTVSFLLFTNKSAAQIYGCTDALATNYNPTANVNDGSCMYNAASVTPSSSFNLNSNLSETSGLIRWNNQIWTHNDNSDIKIYALDTANGNIIKSYPLTGTINTDWEEISQDNDYIYVGDFGNNLNGNRTDLKILRITKNSILMNSPKIDTIQFSYSNQTNFTPTGSNNTDFDCEAFIVASNNIYLFTKQWISNKTTVYSLLKTPGMFSAQPESTYDVAGLITGSVYLESKKLIALCGYNSLGNSFIYLLYDFTGSDYFGGNKRKITVSLPYHQVEGIATTDGLKYYISNEQFTMPPYATIPQKLHILDLKSYLENYLESIPTAISKTGPEGDYAVYPLPAGSYISVIRRDNLQEENYSLINYSGQIILTGKLKEKENHIDISSLSCGIYFLNIGEKKIQPIKVIKR